MKISKTTANTVIGYKKDFDIKDPTLEKKQFRIRVPNSHDEYMEVVMADGESTELMMESFDKLDEIRNQVATAWTARERFHQLGTILTDDAKEAYDEIVADDYPTNADKTHPHYEELKKQIITKLSDHVNPGDKVCTYLESKVKYEWCKDEKTGTLVRPIAHFKRCKTLRRLGGLMHHTHQGTYFDDNRFKTCVWNHFPQEWQDWMTEEQQTDPFDANNPLSTEDIIDKFQHLWNMKIRPQVKANKGRGKRKKDDDDDDDDADDKNSNQGSRKRFKKGGNNNKQGGGGSGNSSSRTNCKIDGHEKYRHDWKGCYLNPYNAKCDHEAAKKYYEEKARGNMAWYRNVYEGYHSRSSHGGGHADGQGRGYQGRGSYRGRGYSGRCGGRGFNNGGRGGRGGRGYYQGNYNNNQGGGNQQGSGNSDGYFNHQNGGYEQGYQQGPPQQQQSYHFGMTPGTQMRPQAPNVPQGPSSSSQGNYSYQRG